ncbi:tnfaip3-interacting protein 1 [Limosa lapponica baueri]|uniref:Tnfaip3-interacting protein 1 n=1 Tax=Limosa lapponica baueri TaxID=1758121 RepID=A0A2I0TDA6_LIMLA|nr:tnfaip3-interacting protein 1 [Limosa lapponica baueri]
MEGRRPYRIYDPGGGTEENGPTAFERLVEENTRLKEKMQGIKSIAVLMLLMFAPQTLCETLHSENKELRTKLERDLEQRNQALEKLRCENQELRRMVTLSNQDSGKREAAEQQQPASGTASAKALRVPPVRVQQSGAAVEKAPGRGELEAKEKKVKILEHQRRELLEVNKQWDQHFRATKQKYEQKVTDLHQELAEARRALTEMESEREQKQRDFDRKLLLAKSRIETEEASPTERAEKERLAMEVRDLQQRMRFLQEQLAPVTRQREYQEKEIQRLNKPEYPWRPPCAMARSQNTQAVAGVKPVPKDLEQAGPGLP